MIIEVAIKQVPVLPETFIKIEVVEEFNTWTIQSQLIELGSKRYLFDLNTKTMYNVSDCYSIRII